VATSSLVQQPGPYRVLLPPPLLPSRPKPKPTCMGAPRAGRCPAQLIWGGGSADVNEPRRRDVMTAYEHHRCEYDLLHVQICVYVCSSRDFAPQTER
jgi:hypothetical protein